MGNGQMKEGQGGNGRQGGLGMSDTNDYGADNSNADSLNGSMGNGNNAVVTRQQNGNKGLSSGEQSSDIPGLDDPSHPLHHHNNLIHHLKGLACMYMRSVCELLVAC